MIRKDTLWKGIIEDLVEEFMQFFFPDYIQLIDLSRGFHFLDKELAQLSPRAATPLRQADKLFKSWLKSGSEQWFLVHVEVQGYPDPGFAQRMFEYAYRIQDRFSRPLTALVIYTSTDRRYHFSEYFSAFFGTEIRYRFHTFILIDHTPQQLRRSGQLFALVLEIARQELDRRTTNDQELLQIKLELVRHLFQRGIPKDKVRHLLDFIGQYIRFENTQFLHKFEEQLQVITKSAQPMGIREAILQEVKEQGLEQGVAQGMEKGILVARYWKKGLKAEQIAELVDMPVEKITAMIRQLEDEA